MELWEFLYRQSNTQLSLHWWDTKKDSFKVHSVALLLVAKEGNRIIFRAFFPLQEAQTFSSSVYIAKLSGNSRRALLSSSDFGRKMVSKAKASNECSQPMPLPCTLSLRMQLLSCIVLVQLPFLQWKFPLLLGHTYPTGNYVQALMPDFPPCIPASVRLGYTRHWTCTRPCPDLRISLQ